MGIMIIIAVIISAVSLYDFYDTHNWQQLTSSARNSVVFEHRNKKYGAYSLRKDYNDMFAIIIAAVAGGLFLLLILFTSTRTVYIAVAALPETDTTQLIIPAPPVEDILEPTPMKIKEGGGGSGTPSDAPFDPTPDPQIKKQDTQKNPDEAVKSGQGNKNTGENKDNKASTTVKAPNPFGSGGSGGGDKGGRGKGFGNDEGNGSGVGKGDGSGTTKRVRLNNPNTDEISTDQSCDIHLKLTINAEGDVIRCDNISSLTTTTDQRIISKVMSIVKSQVKYNKKPGASPEQAFFTINIKAT
jgi:hypothetical protein